MSSNLLRPTKLTSSHLDKAAIVYVRQSSLQQVRHHQSSTQIQYELRDRLVAWGFAEEQIETIDDDLGKSARSAEGRPGFARLVSKIATGRVGLLIGRDSSRLARSCSDWYALLEGCAARGTLIADVDGVYDPACYNDRLLLGLKGTMSEAELHLLKQRMHAGRRHKAERGELRFPLPMGYVWSPDGAIERDPDERARAALEALFDAFARHATLHGALCELVGSGARMPHRRRRSPRKGELEWRRPNRITLGNVLRHPLYAGAYVYGRRRTDPARSIPGRPSTGRVVAAPEEWQSLIRDNHEGYISWAQYELNVRQLDANQCAALGTPGRGGGALLGGLLRCAKCGCRLQVSYDARSSWSYRCANEAINYAGPVCQSLRGARLDAWVGARVLEALAPAALELSLEAAGQLERRRAELRARHDREVESARYESERARRQYDAVEPENRLVARSLEQRWNRSLVALKAAERERSRALEGEAAGLSALERRQIEAAAADLGALWGAPTTSAGDRQRIARALIEAIEVEVVGESERVEVTIEWSGGERSSGSLRRPVARWEQVSYYDEMLDALGAWREEGLSHGAMAARLDAHPEWFPPKRSLTFSRAGVATLLGYLDAREGARRESGVEPRAAGERWSVAQLARALEMPQPTVYAWLVKGVVRGTKEVVGSRARWRLDVNEEEFAELKRRRQRKPSWSEHTRITHPV